VWGFCLTTWGGRLGGSRDLSQSIHLGFHRKRPYLDLTLRVWGCGVWASGFARTRPRLGFRVQGLGGPQPQEL
jgi:hypothetical protein